MSLFTPPPPPPTKLARYRQFAPRAAIHVSPLILGGMSIGDKWASYGFGAMDKDSSFKLLDAYFEAGGNFLDTANNYQDGSSEQTIGEWVTARKNRSQVIISTKYTNTTHRGDPGVTHQENFLGNNLKNMRLSLESSLKNLQTDYVDVFYLHYWDLHTSVEEVMDGLHQLVLSGKVLYLGVSDSPAWWVVKANEYARYNGKTPFVVYQAAYSVVQRDIEREILPMCRHEGLALTFWNVLAQGHIRTDAEEEARRASGEKGRQWSGSWERSEDEKKVCKVLEGVAKSVGAKGITSVAIAYVMHKSPYAFPVVGGRKIEHLHANLEALDINLTDEHIKQIEDALPFEIGFPGGLMEHFCGGIWRLLSSSLLTSRKRFLSSFWARTTHIFRSTLTLPPFLLLLLFSLFIPP
ncbi:aryl-alcohol dehydrogenase [Irpex rosettiformis]|uniref:Aryl-alcohol dehydrogenase n=1 Tax=Irpex rosettiformis TaxID=378272 RepID=A0ACB8U2Q4_9APHY|nr:aryl-alcohol dehydrogenase [Irpex rosettiformis]